ncbi:MAG: aldehyde dehydrogenase family protein [Candidatus Micrarchaeaceae archaeon]
MPKRAFKNEFTYKTFLENGKENEFDALFDEAAERAKMSFGEKHPMMIGDEAVYAQEMLTEKSPIDSSIVIGYFQKGTRDHAKQAIAAAKAAFASWSTTDYRKRAEIFRKAADLFAREKFNIAAILSYENAKSRYESIGEVDEAIDFMRYYAEELEVNKGYLRKTTLDESKVKSGLGFQGAPSNAEKVVISMKPYGVFGVIAPFNFPVSISTGMSVGAMITGNTVVFKPSSSDNMTMLTGYTLYKLFREAGLPAGVFNYITGPGSEVGDELVTNKDVSGIVFTGSRETGLRMLSKVYSAGMQKVFVVEMGGKNPTIVSKYADLEAAVNGVASAAFGFAGQKCSALSRVYVHDSVKELFISKLIDKVRSFRIGNPISKENYMGPLISESAYKRYLESVEKIKAAGRLLYGGNAVQTGLSGYYVEPVIAELSHDHELFHKELFVPILVIDGYKSFDEALNKANDVEYGLTAGLYSKNNKEIKEFSGKIEAGVVYINRSISATTGAIVGLHTFVGWKGSGLTGKGTGSRFYLQQFLREQSVSTTTTA